MKIAAVPASLPIPEWTLDMSFEELEQAEQAHQAQLAEWVKANGFNGEHSGKILYEPFADGYAIYMLAHGHTSRENYLIHLAYGDAWHSPNVEWLPLEEVIRRIVRSEDLNKMFEGMGL